jgi:hypothetical protein
MEGRIMEQSPSPPKLIGTSGISISKKVLLVLECPNPTCKHSMDVSHLALGTHIQCPRCNNVTWVPEFKPRWWFQGKNFITSIIVAFIIGVLSSLTATWLYQKYHP